MLFIYLFLRGPNGRLVSSQGAHANSTVKVPTLFGPVKCPVTSTRQEAIMSQATTGPEGAVKVEDELFHQLSMMRVRMFIEMLKAPTWDSAIRTKTSFGPTLRMAFESTSQLRLEIREATAE